MSTLNKGTLILAILAAGAGFGVGLAAADPMGDLSWTSRDQEAVEQYKDYLAGPEMAASGPIGTGAVQASDSGGFWSSGYYGYGEEKTGSVPGPDTEQFWTEGYYGYRHD